MTELKLFMVMVGCRPEGRNTEQHDVLFGIGRSIKDLVPQIKDFWPGSGAMHVDAWREVNYVDGFKVSVLAKDTADKQSESDQESLFFMNLGGYKAGEFDEFHYKLLVVAGTTAEAVKKAKQTAFYKHTSAKGAESHIDDKFGVDVDDLFKVKDILLPEIKQQYYLQLTPATIASEDEMHLGYFQLHKL
jgi:hypothetical protein